MRVLVYALALAALVAATLGAAADAVRAAGGVPLPAPAGTTWSIVAGYNTGTHSEGDGQDPHAIDLVRTDAATDWTAVLSPADGIVTWRGDSCLTIRDANGYAHLLCHIAPHGSIARGMTVSVGDELGQVFPAGYDANGGIAHIHYAIHHTAGSGRLGRSIPFVGAYAVEGRELPYSNSYNLHAGTEFTSSNARGWTPPASSPTNVNDANQKPPQDAAAPAPRTEPHTGPHDAPAQPATTETRTAPLDAPAGGWRAVGVHERTSVAGLFANLQSPLVALVVHNPFLDTYHRFDPADAGSAQVAVQSLQPGQAVWAEVQADARWLPPSPSTPREVALALVEGANMVSWQGSERTVEQALANVAQLERAYRYDPHSKSWRLYDPAAPAFLNTFGLLRPGDAFYLQVGAASTWTQLP